MTKETPLNATHDHESGHVIRYPTYEINHPETSNSGFLGS